MNHDTIKAKIQSLVPELMELSFGCEVKIIKDESESVWRYMGKSVNSNKDAWECVWSNFATARYSDQISDEKYIILGHPIQLHHVLRAIPQRITMSGLKKFEGGVPVVPIGLARLLMKWNPTTDFDDQTDELKNFVGNLLGTTYEK